MSVEPTAFIKAAKLDNGSYNVYLDLLVGVALPAEGQLFRTATAFQRHLQRRFAEKAFKTQSPS